MALEKAAKSRGFAFKSKEAAPKTKALEQS
jgi:hypothetical protein